LEVAVQVFYKVDNRVLIHKEVQQLFLAVQVLQQMVGVEEVVLIHMMQTILDLVMVGAGVEEVEVDMEVLEVRVHKVVMEVGEQVGHLEMGLVAVVEHINLEETDLVETEVVVVVLEMLITGLVLVVVMVVEEEVVHILDNLLVPLELVVEVQEKHILLQELLYMVITDHQIQVEVEALKVVVEVQE
jgi:hypothetical protein